MKTERFDINYVCIMSAQELRALCEFASSDETRTQLNAVLLDIEAGCAVATDGHTLVRCVGQGYVPRAGHVLVSKADCLAAVKAAGAGGTVAVCVGPDGVTACSWTRKQTALFPVTADIAVTRPPVMCPTTRAVIQVDAAFPPYQQVIPAPGPLVCEDTPCRNGSDVLRDHEAPRVPVTALGLSGAYLARLAMVGAICNDRSCGVALTACPGPLEPVRFDASGPESGDWTVVIMPMRIGSGDISAERADTVARDRARESRETAQAAE